MGMVKQTRHIFDVGDLLAVRLYCGECTRETVQSLDNAEVPKRCPMCHAEWEDNLTGSNRGYNWQLIRAMKTLLKDANDNPPARMTIRFEIDGEVN